MGIFSKITSAIFGHKSAQSPAQRPQIPAGMAGGPPASAAPAPAQSTAPAAPSAPVDVEQVLSEISSSKGNPDLNYKSSIVDLLKLLGLESNLDSRKELADELGYTGEKDGSAEMNMWLHKEVMRQLAANGGKVPASMTD